MYKEMIISIVLVFFIFIGDFITQNYTKNTIDTLTNELDDLKQSLIDNDEKANLENKVEQISKTWEEVHKKLAYYLEHDELEKVETDFTSFKSFIKTENYDLAINELEKAVFVLDHITDKYSFSLENIF